MSVTRKGAAKSAENNLEHAMKIRKCHENGKVVGRPLKTTTTGVEKGESGGKYNTVFTLTQIAEAFRMPDN